MALRRSAGFTLIELLVTIAIAAILLALALPTFTESIRANRVSTATNQMLATLNFARSEAVRSKSDQAGDRPAGQHRFHRADRRDPDQFRRARPHPGPGHVFLRAAGA
ncbi:MAG: prepilin-type N-terminal cleavage/methylation domain-containing protein [Lysobacter sp.]|nr:prepilin-type N-terminal cleavage/methylation domain-containing protein [Lysobacter sp.]